MRIGIDARLPFYQMGGISRYVLQLLPALARLDNVNEYVVFHSRRDNENYAPATSNFRSRNLWTPCHHRLEKWTLGLELLPHNLDVMHSPDFIPPQFGARRKVITVPDLNFLYYPQFLTDESRRYYRDQIQWAVDKADHIVAISHYTRDDLLRKLQVPESKVTAIPLAADPVFEEVPGKNRVEGTLREYGLQRGFVLFVGTLEPRKNISMLLRAYARLRRKKAIEAPLVLVGQRGWLFTEIFETIEQEGIDGHVRHLQGVGDKDLAALYHAAGVLACPSHYEGFGFPVVEAMHCGCPVIASDRASLPEVVGSAGLLLDADDEVAWADAIYRVLTDEELRSELIPAGFEQARRFTWEKTAGATLRVYEQLN